MPHGPALCETITGTAHTCGHLGPSKANATQVTVIKPWESIAQLCLHMWNLTPAVSRNSLLDWLLFRRAGLQQVAWLFPMLAKAMFLLVGAIQFTRNVKEYSLLCQEWGLSPEQTVFHHRKAALKRETFSIPLALHAFTRSWKPTLRLAGTTQNCKVDR